MANYSIDTMNGNEICSGIQDLGQAQEVAQRRANERNESVVIFGDDLGDEGVTVEPEVMVFIDEENPAEEWWTAAREAFPAIMIRFEGNAATITRSELAQLKALPGWSDGPEYARTALRIG